MKKDRSALSAFWLLMLVLSAQHACSSAKVSGTDETGGRAGATGQGTPPPSGAPSITLPPASGPFGSPSPGGSSQDCRGLECNKTTCARGACTQKPCADGQSTTVSGVIYDPAGRVPLYNIVVYVPNGPLAPIVEGVTCDRCQTSIEGAVTATLSDAKGAFKLNDVPVGRDIPLVIEAGKWRREIKIPVVSACTDTAMLDKNLTRLPRNQREGHIPKIALTTGRLDALECLLRKIGIDDSEFTPETGSGRINLFSGVGGTNSYAPALNGAAPLAPAQSWWDKVDNLKRYDIVLLSCDGISNPSDRGPAALEAFQSYTNAGGRVFASHWHNYWIRAASPPLSTVATFGTVMEYSVPVMSTIDTTFPKGVALADWLVNVNASPTRGTLQIHGAKHTVLTLNPMLAQRWIYLEGPGAVQYLTANTPVGAAADAQCGRIVFSDLHVSAGLSGPMDDRSNPGVPFPTGCVSTELSPQEKALEFMLFDLSSCVRRDDIPPSVD